MLLSLLGDGLVDRGQLLLATCSQRLLLAMVPGPAALRVLRLLLARLSAGDLARFYCRYVHLLG